MTVFVNCCDSQHELVNIVSFTLFTLFVNCYDSQRLVNIVSFTVFLYCCDSTSCWV